MCLELFYSPREIYFYNGEQLNADKSTTAIFCYWYKLLGYIRNYRLTAECPVLSLVDKAVVEYNLTYSSNMNDLCRPLRKIV
jgi:hypothetical protein